VCHHKLVVVATTGLYEASGDWLYDVGLPGNNVKGQLVARFLSLGLGMDLFASAHEG
jgi:glutaminase